MLALLAASLMLAPYLEPTRPTDAHPLVVHEWGTFTTFSGADGVARKFTT